MKNNTLTLIKKYILLNFFITLSVVSFSIPVYADDTLSDTHKLRIGGHFATGLYEGGEAFGLGLSLGALLRKQDRLYTLRATYYIDLFDDLFESDCERKEGSTVLVCESDDEKTGQISEYAILYGSNWKSLWLSAGVGYIEGENVGGLFASDDEKTDFSSFGLAYSILWDRDLRGYGIELSGNINDENNYVMLSGRITLTQ